MVFSGALLLERDMNDKTLFMVCWLSSGHRFEVHQIPIDQPSAFGYRLVGFIHALAGESVASDFVEAADLVGVAADAIDECHPVTTIDVVRIGPGLDNGTIAA